MQRRGGIHCGTLSGIAAARGRKSKLRTPAQDKLETQSRGGPEIDTEGGHWGGKSPKLGGVGKYDMDDANSEEEKTVYFTDGSIVSDGRGGAASVWVTGGRPNESLQI